MNDDRQALLNEARYAERLCLRTARLYRRIGTAFTFASVLGGSGALTAMSGRFPDWIAISGACVLAIFGAVNLAVRPAEKAAANEADAKRYAGLRTASGGMDAATLREALNKAREADAMEIESLRDVAYNDIVHEIGRPEAAVRLRLHQRLLSAIA